MTKEEKIIATAFTGKMFIDGSEMGSLYEYMEKKVGHGVIDLMLASKEFWEELHKACEQDFIDMVSKEQFSLPSNLDEAAEEIAKSEIPVVAGESLDLNGDCYETDDINWPERCGFIRGFKAGAEWMAGQGVEAKVLQAFTDGSAYIECPYEGRSGDKVVVQIRKK